MQRRAKLLLLAWTTLLGSCSRESTVSTEQAEGDAGAPGVAFRSRLEIPVKGAPTQVRTFDIDADGLPELAREIVDRFFERGIAASYDEQHAIGKRYRRHDEIGTPWCLTVDGQSREEGTVTGRRCLPGNDLELASLPTPVGIPSVGCCPVIGGLRGIPPPSSNPAFPGT